jgi:hypothetical protein
MEHASVAAPMTLDAADELVVQLLGARRTKLGGVHIDHAPRVARAASDDDPRVTIVALLHDVIEKTDITLSALRVMIADSWVADAVEALTKRDDESEWMYLARCAADPVICRLKRLGLVDKLDCDDVLVAADIARRLRLQARHRLRALEHLAAAHHPCRGGAGPPPHGRSSAQHRREQTWSPTSRPDLARRPRCPRSNSARSSGC